jgi:hypothetical protein
MPCLSYLFCFFFFYKIREKEGRTGSVDVGVVTVGMGEVVGKGVGG